MKSIELDWNHLILSFGAALDLMSPKVAAHHFDVAFFSYHLLKEMAVPDPMVQKAIRAALLHDIGIFSLEERLESLNFEFEEEQLHAEIGAELLESHSKLKGLSEIIRHHHRPHSEARVLGTVPFESETVFLADRASVLLAGTERSPFRGAGIFQELNAHRGTKFHPDLLDALGTVLESKAFWDAYHQDKRQYVLGTLRPDLEQLTLTSLMETSHLFARIIDFKSLYTAAHSIGVGRVAAHLATLKGEPEERSLLLEFSGMVHDIGKVVVPKEILEKPSVITAGERAIIETHPVYTAHILEALKGLEPYNAAAAFHHEHLDGSGYPYGLHADALSGDTRLIAIADVFTALTEQRAYRAAFKPEDVMRFIKNSAMQLQLDRELVEIVIRHHVELCEVNRRAQAEAITDYQRLYACVQKRKSLG